MATPSVESSENAALTNAIAAIAKHSPRRLETSAERRARRSALLWYAAARR
jgi:hypothetical protein